MEGDDGQASPRRQQADHGIDGALQYAQLFIQLYSYGLKGTLGRMASRGPDLCGNRCLYNLRQLSRGPYGLLFPCPHNMLCNVFREAVLPVIPYDAVQFSLVIGIDNICRSAVLPVIHTHIQGASSR